MILAIQADHTVVLLQPDDLRRFHVEVDAALDLPAARQAFASFGDIESTETAWVGRRELLALGRAVAGDPWLAQAETMLEGAARHGWTRGQEPSIRSHVVWRRQEGATLSHPTGAST
ncbi:MULTISPECIES: hypothetical protein [Ramlibacter]|uniref:hypothetical protein n=1 Tax=Ramlibacter TaxID=174951 RepID=UPI0012FBB18C|nr:MULTISPECIES: hypothetical protein [Ramlibacter]MBA2961003.1 hypothetical protein [Ramlibacter sp. CGMCC 1.13660]